jgi:apolipoprotein N-acyltransferase
MVAHILEISYTLVTVALLAFFLKKSLTIESIKKRIKHWLLFGLIFNAYSYTWLFTVYPLPWLQDGALQLIGIFLLYVIVTAQSALCYGVVALSQNARIHKVFLPLLFAATLVVAELARSLLLSILFYGKGTTIALHLTAGTLGNALSTTPLIEFAYFGGTFALTFVLGYLVYCGLSKKNCIEHKYHFALFFILTLFIHTSIPVRAPVRETSIGIVTTDYEAPTGQNYKSIFREQSKNTHSLTKSFVSSTTFIVYPEDGRYLSYLTKEEKEELNIKFNKTVFIDGDTMLLKGGLSTVSYFYYPKGDKKVARGKDFLLPFNEYVPYIFEGAITLFVGKENMESFKKLHTFSPVHSIKTLLVDDVRIGTLLCSEILSYSIIRSLAKENPDVVFFQAHLSVFHNNPIFIMHLRSFTKIAAAQLRTPIIMSTDGAPSYIISPNGKIIQSLPAGTATSSYILSP